MKKYKIAILDMAPSHYRTPIYSKLEKNKNIDLTVYFSSGYGMKKQFNPQYNIKMKWDYKIDDFNHQFLKNYSKAKNPAPPKNMWNFGIIKKIIKNKFDAIIIVSYTPLSHKLAILTAKLFGTPVILKEEIDLGEQPTGFRGHFKKIFLRFLIRISDAILYGYKKNKEFFEHYDAKDEKLFFFPCAVNNEMFQKQRKQLPSKFMLRKKLGIRKDHFVGIFIGRLIKQKNVLDIILSAEIVQKKGIPFSLIIVGDGIEKKHLKETASERKIKNIYFVGLKQQNKLAKYAKVSDLSILASNEDRSPKSLNEMMNFGLPSIVTNKVKTYEDLVIQNKTGFVFEVGDTEKLAEYIEKLYKNKRLYNKISKNVSDLIKMWTFDKDIDGLMEALKHVKKD